jgi:hypothetical protein
MYFERNIENLYYLGGDVMSVMKPDFVMMVCALVERFTSELNKVCGGSGQ